MIIFKKGQIQALSTVLERHEVERSFIPSH